MVDAGLCAAVYTQLTDIEGEINGYLTYDRKSMKMDIHILYKLHHGLQNR